MEPGRAILYKVSSYGAGYLAVTGGEPLVPNGREGVAFRGGGADRNVSPEISSCALLTVYRWIGPRRHYLGWWYIVGYGVLRGLVSFDQSYSAW
jgi:hypothetical protein